MTDETTDELSTMNALSSNIHTPLQKRLRDKTYDLISSQYTPELIEKKLSEYNEKIQLHQTQTAELRRSTELRSSGLVSYESSLASASKVTNMSVAKALTMAETPTTRPVPQHGSHTISHPTQNLGKRFSLSSASHPKATEKTTVGPLDSEHQQQLEVMNESIFHELSEQLKGEKVRVTELSAKINELHGLEEEQRRRARALEDERNAIVEQRDQMEEELAQLRSTCEGQLVQLESKTNRIVDLEKLLSDYMDRESELRDQVVLAEESNELAEAQRDGYLSKMNEASNKLRSMISRVQEVSDENDELRSQLAALQAERDAALQQVDGKESTIGQREKEFSEISNHNQELIRTNNDLTERMKQLEETVRIARSDSEMLRAEFDEMSRANQILIADNDKLKARIGTSEAEVQRAEDVAAEARQIAEKHKNEYAIAMEKLTKAEHIVEEVEKERSHIISVQQGLVKRVDAEKKSNHVTVVYHRSQTLLLLTTIWALIIGIIYNYIVDFKPCTHDDYRFTS